MKKDVLTRILAVLAALAVWQLAAMSVGSRILLATPWQALERLLALLPTAGLWRTVGCSFVRIAGGFLLALALGTALALAAYRWRVVETLLRPYVVVIKSVPVASFIILALIWMGSARLPLFISFLMVFPVIYGNTLQGLKSTDPQLLEMARLFRVPWARRLRYIHLPALEPFLLAGCSTALGMSWKAGVAAEVIGIPTGSIGEQLYQSKVYFDLTSLYAWTVAIVLVSVLFEKAVLLAVRLLYGRLEQL